MSPSFLLLITTLQGGLHPDRQQRLISVIRQATDAHWQGFINLCDEHNVSNLTRSSFHKNSLWDSLPRRKSASPRVNNNDHCQTYYQAKSYIVIEIHHQAFPNAFRFTRNIEELLTNSTLVEFHSISMRHLSLEDEFLLLLCQGAKHHWCQLNWLYDFAFFTQFHQNSLDWGKIKLQVNQPGCFRIVKCTFALCEEIWQTSILPPQLDRPGTDSTACRLADLYSTQLQSSASPHSHQNRLHRKYHGLINSLLCRERYRDRLPVILSLLRK